MNDNLSRRDFVKTSVAAATAAAVGVPMAGAADPAGLDSGIAWEKSVCRFCGVGCGVVVGTKNGHIAAVKGDPESPVNRGLLCVKGYSNAYILYGADRLHKPLLRMKNGRFDKGGDFTEVSWERAFDEMERQFKRHHSKLGPTAVGIMGSGQYTIPEGYAAVKLAKAGAPTWPRCTQCCGRGWWTTDYAARTSGSSTSPPTPTGPPSAPTTNW